MSITTEVTALSGRTLKHESEDQNNSDEALDWGKTAHSLEHSESDQGKKRFTRDFLEIRRRAKAKWNLRWLISILSDSPFLLPWKTVTDTLPKHSRMIRVTFPGCLSKAWLKDVDRVFRS